jgi:glyoxylase-like metal-dependent hydrolase (beta-lactamase superfamily II)
VSAGAVGELSLACVHDADIRLSPEELFLDWDDEAVGPVAASLGPRYYDPGRRLHTLPVHCWVLREGGRIVLVDTGCGDRKWRPDLPDLHLLRTGFLGRLHAAGVRPQDVDVVLCTHLHADHVGWNTRLRDGRWVPTFPNARYLVSKVELDHLASIAADPDGAAMLREVYVDSVVPVVEAGQVDTVDGAFELGHAITLRPAPGHTPGHIRIDLRSRGAVATLSGDIVHTPLQAPFWRWRTALADDPEQDLRTRRALLEDCVEHDALLVPAHFHPPAVGRVRAAGDAFAIELGW